MNEFLAQFDHMIGVAKRQGEVCAIGTEVRDGDKVVGIQLTARTMHPSFMPGANPKHDPERDK